MTINPVAAVPSTSFEHPYTFARRISTADHLTKGRVGWNIVTSYLESGAKNLGNTGLRRHDNRYKVANEYLEVIYKLLEGSWEDGAVVRDRERRIFADPGTRSNLALHGLDRHWRKARVHTLHDPVRWKFHIVGNYYLNDVDPPRHPWS